MGDISGANGIPDGIVDLYDLVEMGGQWLYETSAPVSTSESNLTGSYKLDKNPKKVK